MIFEEKFIESRTVQQIFGNITFSSDLRETVKERDYVIEVVPEILELKQNLFKQLDEICLKHTILASNTFSLQLNAMMFLVGEKRKERMIVNHWYNPAHLMPIVELSYFGNMPEAIYIEVEQLYGSIRKQTVKVLKDIPGLVANRIQQRVGGSRGRRFPS